MFPHFCRSQPEAGGSWAPQGKTVRNLFSTNQNSKTRIAGQLKEEAGPCTDPQSQETTSTTHVQKRLLGGQRGVTSRMFSPDALSVKSTLAEMCARTWEDPEIQGKGAGSQACQGDWPKEETPQRSDWRCHRGQPGAVPLSCPAPAYTRPAVSSLSGDVSQRPSLWELFCRAGDWAPRC